MMSIGNCKFSPLSNVHFLLSDSISVEENIFYVYIHIRGKSELCIVLELGKHEKISLFLFLSELR